MNNFQPDPPEDFSPGNCNKADAFQAAVMAGLSDEEASAAV